MRFLRICLRFFPGSILLLIQGIPDCGDKILSRIAAVILHVALRLGDNFAGNLAAFCQILVGGPLGGKGIQKLFEILRSLREQPLAHQNLAGYHGFKVALIPDTDIVVQAVIYGFFGSSGRSCQIRQFPLVGLVVIVVSGTVKSDIVKRGKRGYDVPDTVIHISVNEDIAGKSKLGVQLILFAVYQIGGSLRSGDDYLKSSISLFVKLILSDIKTDETVIIRIAPRLIAIPLKIPVKVDEDPGILKVAVNNLNVDVNGILLGIVGIVMPVVAVMSTAAPCKRKGSSN